IMLRISRLLFVMVLGIMLLVIVSGSTNAQRNQISPDDSQSSIHPTISNLNLSFENNATAMLSGEVFIPLAFSPYPQGTFLGKIVFVTYRSGTARSELFIMNADGSNQTPLVQDSANNFSADWSPNNSHIAFTKQTDPNDFETSEIYSMNADGTSQINLTNNDTFDGSPVWSPDGTKIAFLSYRDGHFNVYVMNSDGSNPVQLTTSSYHKYDPTWSPDSNRIAYLEQSEGYYRIMIMNADGSNPGEIHSSEDLNFTGLTWSPDGSKFAFSSRLSGDIETSNIFTIFANGANLKQLTFQPNNVYPSWSADGSQLAYANYEPYSNYSEIFVMNTDGSSPVNITQHPKFDGGPAWSK
ncbi:MAG: hypothetical protein WAM60_16260, partial [Candidatus Promineifilaceae bacterium]